MHGLRALLRKEFLQIVRDRRTLVTAIVLPAALLLLFGYGLTTDITHVRILVQDRDRTPASRALLDRFTSSGFFDRVGTASSRVEVERALARRDALAAVVVPVGFERAIARGEPTDVQVLLDGSDSNTATVAQGYIRQILQTTSRSLIQERLEAAGVPRSERTFPIDYRPRVFYNPDLRSRTFLVPGLIGVILTVLAILLASLSLVREKDRGTLEMLRICPLSATQVTVGKLLPYALIGLADAAAILVLGRVLFQVPLRGNLLLLLAGTVIFLLSALGIGLLISALAPSQQTAQTLSFLATVLPVFYLADFIFPLASMPRALRLLSWTVPARTYLVIVRGIIVKGVGLAELAPDFIWLSAYAAGILAAGIFAVRRLFI